MENQLRIFVLHLFVKVDRNHHVSGSSCLHVDIIRMTWGHRIRLAAVAMQGTKKVQALLMAVGKFAWSCRTGRICTYDYA